MRAGMAHCMALKTLLGQTSSVQREIQRIRVGGAGGGATSDDDAARIRRGAIYNDAIREAAIAGDRLSTDDVITRMVANNYVSSALDPKCIACDQSETDCPYPDPLLTCKECGAFFHESCARMFSGRREDEPITDTSNAVCNDCKEMGWDTDDHIERYYETSEEDESEDDEDDEDDGGGSGSGSDGNRIEEIDAQD